MTERTPGRFTVKREAGGVTYLMVGDSYLATIGYVSNSDEELAANAAFLARACNAHDALLGACRLAVIEFGFIPHAERESNALVDLRAAIAQAEGGAA